MSRGDSSGVAGKTHEEWLRRSLCYFYLESVRPVTQTEHFQARRKARTTLIGSLVLAAGVVVSFAAGLHLFTTYPRSDNIQLLDIYGEGASLYLLIQAAVCMFLLDRSEQVRMAAIQLASATQTHIFELRPEWENLFEEDSIFRVSAEDAILLLTARDVEFRRDRIPASLEVAGVTLYRLNGCNCKGYGWATGPQNGYQPAPIS